MKTKINILLVLMFTLVTLSQSTNSTNADNTSNYVPVCKEISQYYDPSLPDAQAGSAPANVKQICNAGDHGAFPSKYIGNFANIPEPNKQSHQGWSIHNHRYINNSKEECFNANNQKIQCPENPASTAYDHVAHKVSSIKKFELTMQSDFMENIYEDSLECDFMNNGLDCNGEGSLGNNLDGKTMGFILTYQKNNNNTATLTWDFGPTDSHPNWVRPIIYGINPILDYEKEVDYSDELYRILELGINFQTKENENINWSATTTSRVLLKDYSATMDQGVMPSSNSDWTPISPLSQYAQTGDNFYWFPIGTATTIWEKPTPPPPENICSSLTIGALDPSLKEDMGNGEMAYRLPAVNVTFTEALPDGLKLLYISQDPNGKFWQRIDIYGDPYDESHDTHFFTPLTEDPAYANNDLVNITALTSDKIYYKGKGPVGVTVVGTDNDFVSQKICFGSILVPGEACEELKVDHPKDIYVGTVSRFSSKAYKIDDTKFGDQVTYWVDHGYGLFYTTKPQDIPNNPSSTVYETFTYQGGSVWKYWDLDAYSTVPGSALIINESANFNILSKSISNGSFFGGYGESENQKGMTMPPVDTIDFGSASVAHAFTVIDTSPQVIMEPLVIKDEIYTINPDIIDITAPDLNLTIPDYKLPDLTYLYESITVPQGTPVYFVALKPGLKKVHAKALGSNVGDCERDFDIKEFNVCKEIKINHPEHIYEKTLSELSAAALNPLGNSFYGKVTYSVDAGYGQFFTTAQGGLQANDSNKVTEFDNSKPIVAPTGGFCSGAQVKDVPAEKPATEKNPADDSGSGGMTLPPNGGIGNLTINGGNTTLPGSTLGTLNPEITIDIMTNPTNYQSLILEKYGTEFLYEVPESFGTGIKPKPSPGPDPVETGGNPSYLNSVVHAFTLIEKEVTIDKIDLVTGIVPPSNGKTTLTVDPGTKVYFWAEKAGTNVVHISANCTDEKNCKRDFSIEAKALVCKEAKLTAHNFNLAANNTAACLAKDGQYGLSTTFYDDKGAEIPSNKIKVKWTTTDPNGKFESMFPVIWNENMEANAFISLSSVKYTGTGQVTAQLYELDGKKYTKDNCKAAIGPCPEANACASLQITSNPADPLLIGQAATLTLTSKDLANAALPAQTQVTWTTDTEGTLKPTTVGNAQPAGNQNTYTGLIGESIAFEGSKKEGKVNVTMTNPADPLYSASCKDDIQVIKQVELPVCTGLEIKDNGVVVQSIEPGKLYKLTSKASYSLAVQGPTSDYSTTQGLLFTKNEAVIAQTLANSGGLTSALAGTLQGTKKTLNKVPDNEEVYLLTFIDAQGQDVLTIQATDRSESVCIKKFSIAAQQTPCQSISVTYYPQPFNPASDVVISVKEGVYGNFNGKFEFSSANKDGSTTNGKFYKAGGEASQANPIKFTVEEAKNGVIYSFGKKGDEITIKAVDANPAALNGINCNFKISEAPQAGLKCLNLSIVEPEGKWTEDDFDEYDEDDKEATQKLKIEVTTDPAGFANNLEYKWEVSGGGNGDLDKTVTKSSDQNPLINYLRDFNPTKNTHITVSAKGWEEACTDTATLNVEGEDLPEIEKAVYDTKDKEWTDTINVGGKAAIGNNWKNPKDQYITYLAVFDPGSSKSVEIWDSTLEGGEIDSDINQGTLDFKDIAIAVEQGNKQYVIYKTPGFNLTRYSNEDIGENPIDDFDDYDEDLDFFAKEYNCDDEHSKVCLDYEYKDEDDHEFNKIFEDFQTGKKIKLSNTDEAEKIYIVYQMENQTKVTDTFCKDMIEDFGVCGEQFDNEINFQAYKDDDFENKLDKGKDTATVIAICPFILAREGGDVFFHDAIETGIDVSACYEVETCEGPCIKPKKEKEEEVISVGEPIDGSQEVQLIAPTHDICKLSNTGETDLESYKNVFKNFSSSVCEMETEVAADWKEKYINEAIKANVEKLARFGESDASGTFASVEAFGTFMNNGVVVTNKNITIDNGSSSFDIQKINNIPAAQTYIIKGGTLTINSNIKYNDNLNATDILNPKNIPSVAFIVIDGNIEISPDVTELDGIYMAVDTEGDPDGEINPTKDDSGNFESTEENILTIRGSLIGDVFHLFENRSAIGDPLKDESSITIKYDERILLNTPPGLTELIDINQLKVAN